jgi:HPt (histidine-containing phosphotransfer) domain-containing protein
VQTLDVDHLDTQTGGDLGLQREILSLFADQSAQILSILQNEGAPLKARADLVHKLSGSARAVGAVHLAAVAAQLEASFRAENPSDALLADLHQAVEAALVSVHRRLALLA